MLLIFLMLPFLEILLHKNIQYIFNFLYLDFKLYYNYQIL